jgi:quercetin dioxygenase-like cupin family protein
LQIYDFRKTTVAHAGKVISNTLMAGTVKFIRTAADTGGDLLEMEATYNTAVDSVPEHYHPYQDEHIKVLAGMVSIHINGQERTYVAGESFYFPRKVPHSFLGAAGSEEARIHWQIRPALDSETLIETVHGLASDGKMKDTGIPNLLQLAVIFRAFNDECQPTMPPRIVQKIVFAILAPIGRLLGYQARYEEYSGPEVRRDTIASIPARR